MSRPMLNLQFEKDSEKSETGTVHEVVYQDWWARCNGCEPELQVRKETKIEPSAEMECWDNVPSSFLIGELLPDQIDDFRNTIQPDVLKEARGKMEAHFAPFRTYVQKSLHRNRLLRTRKRKSQKY